MWDFLKNTVLIPGAQRLGTIAATVVLTGGDWLCSTYNACGLVTQSGAEKTIAWVIAAAFVIGDLVVIEMTRRRKAVK